MSRIADAIRALRGRLPDHYVRWADFEKVDEMILDWERIITTTLEKLNAYYARERKRQKREHDRLADAVSEPPSQPATPGIADRKAELRRRAYGGGHPSIRRNLGGGHVDGGETQ